MIPEAADAAMYARPPTRSRRARALPPARALPAVGRRRCGTRSRRKHVASSPRRRASCRSCSSAPTRPWAHELPERDPHRRVADEHLAAIYTGAHALVLASEDEGFGLPAVEALACGTPVVACESPALREVLGERATFVEPATSRR